LLLIILAASIFYLLPTQTQGALVVRVSQDSPLFGKVSPGEVITWVNEKDIKTVSDFESFENFTGSLRFIHNGKLEIASISKPGLGVDVTQQSPTRLNFGLDVIGGTRALIEPTENVSDATIQQIISTFETRINTYGLKEAKFQAINDVISGKKYVQIEFAGGTKEEMKELIEKQGKFEGKIPKVVKFTNNKGMISVGNKTYDVLLAGNVIEINNKQLKANDSIELSGIKAEVLNVTNDSSILMFTVFTGNDIKSVCLVEQPNICTSRVYQTGKNQWEFMFSVTISDEGAQRFADVTKGMQVFIDPNSGHSYLESKLYLFLDEKPLSDLSIAGDLAGRSINNPVITGGGATRSEASEEMLRLKSILQSGALPVSINIVKIDQISPSLGAEFINSAQMAALVAVVAVFMFLLVRYRNIKISSLMVLWTIFEVIIILGIAAMIKWTLDLPSIVAIITIIGTGIDVQIMIVDEILYGKRKAEAVTIKQKIKDAFFMVFGSASTVIAAMLPMIFVGIGIMRGFAITTCIGVLVGLFITRPAFASVMERVLGKEK
jgi:preprotein translocase subunit SecD